MRICVTLLLAMLVALFISYSAYAEDPTMPARVNIVQCGKAAQIEQACQRNSLCCVLRDRLIVASNTYLSDSNGETFDAVESGHPASYNLSGNYLDADPSDYRSCLVGDSQKD